MRSDTDEVVLIDLFAVEPGGRMSIVYVEREISSRLGGKSGSAENNQLCGGTPF